MQTPNRRLALSPRLLTLVYSAGLVGAFAGMLLDNDRLVVVSGVVSLLADVPAVLRPINKRSQLRGLVTVVTRQIGRGALLLVAMVAVTQAHERATMIAALAVVMVMALAHCGYRLLNSYRLRRWSALLQWRNLDVHRESIPGSAPSPRRATGAIGFLLAELIYIGALLVLDRDDPTAAIAGLLLAASVAVVTIASAVVTWLRSPPPDRAAQANGAVLEALRSYGPEVVVYFSSPQSGTYALTVWTDVVNALRPRTVVLVRESVHLPALEALTVPIVVLPTATDVEAFHLDSMRVVLYPTNVIRNNHMVRLPGLLHCFIGHGDSDKAGSFSPVSRMYDEIWVAGQAGVDRYRAAAEGFILDRLRIVGRPQLAHIRLGEPLTPDRPLTVLYAPTWEGFFELSDYSSVAPMGVDLVSRLLGRGARVLYKPHPATGQRLKDATRVSDEIAELLESAGGDSGVVPPAPGALYDAFNEADVVITDVSSVISDFLASRKPLVVTNPKRFSGDVFATMFPSTRACYVIEEPAELDGALDDVVRRDSMKEERERYAVYLLGEPHGDPFVRFLDEVDAFVRRAGEERDRRERARAEFERSTPWLAQ